jgi:hypothetical protein
MITLQIEHEVRDFATWKEAFDSDPLDRSASGVRSFRIARPLDQEDYVMLEMDFDTQEAAVDFLARLQNDTWKTVNLHSLKPCNTSSPDLDLSGTALPYCSSPPRSRSLRRSCAHRSRWGDLTC